MANYEVDHVKGTLVILDESALTIEDIKTIAQLRSLGYQVSKKRKASEKPFSQIMDVEYYATALGDEWLKIYPDLTDEQKAANNAAKAKHEKAKEKWQEEQKAKGLKTTGYKRYEAPHKRGSFTTAARKANKILAERAGK